MKHENAVIVEAYDLASFVVSVAEHAKKGYVVDLQSNETYPQMLGINYFICGMKLALDVEDVEVVGVQMELELAAETTTEVAEVTTPAETTDGTRPKNPKFTPKTKKEPK